MNPYTKEVRAYLTTNRRCSSGDIPMLSRYSHRGNSLLSRSSSKRLGLLLRQRAICTTAPCIQEPGMPSLLRQHA